MNGTVSKTTELSKRDKKASAYGRVVTGNVNGRSVVQSDEQMEAYRFKTVPGYEHTLIWVNTCRTTSPGLTFGRVRLLAISVSTGPACTPNTCVPCSRKPVRSQFVKAQAAALEALYVPALGTATQLSTERTLTMAPPPFFARTGAKARLSRSGPK
jgi:hypothetical protein